MTRNQKAALRTLRDALRTGDPKKLEKLAAALVCELTGVPVAVAKSGFQYGGDAGTAGAQGRRLRIETKRYAAKTVLRDRELQGELVQAVERDPTLEGWILVATRAVPEQLQTSLVNEGEHLGVPVIIWSWPDGGALGPLAALCAKYPQVIADLYSPAAAKAARTLKRVADTAIEQAIRDIESWNLGFASIRKKSHERLLSIWQSPRGGQAHFGQNVARCDISKRIVRRRVHQAIDLWWNDASAPDEPLALVGSDGVGKTWAAIAWLVDRASTLPIILAIPSTVVTDLSSLSESGVLRFLAHRLLDLTERSCDVEHWERRLTRLLSRPADEGAVLTLLFDGLNQQSADWIQLLRLLQNDRWVGRIRVLLTTRPHHFSEKLKNLRGLVVPARRAEVDSYDLEVGGELDSMLALEGLKRGDLQADLIELARNPRLFSLVIHLRTQITDTGQITVHRLLWEYGRDTLCHRATHSFSENEWREWLATIADEYRKGVRDFSFASIGTAAHRADLTSSELLIRLSDIVDGHFGGTNASSNSVLAPNIVVHALGAGLLRHLDGVSPPTSEAIQTALDHWLDPIAGLDQRAEILRAATSILVHRGMPECTASSRIVAAWLQSQNLDEDHLAELAALAGLVTIPLLDTIEWSKSSGQRSTRVRAVNALQSGPRDDDTFALKMIGRLTEWMRITSRDVDKRDADHDKLRSERWIRCIGTDTDGDVQVLGVRLILVERDDDDLDNVAAALLRGFPLALAAPIFEVAAVKDGLPGLNDFWSALKWLVLLNDVDPDETRLTLKAIAADALKRVPRAGMDRDLPQRLAARLLALTGEEDDERQACEIPRPHLVTAWDYARDYLADPSRSMYEIERRHAPDLLRDATVKLHIKMHRCGTLLLDPTFDVPPEFVEAVGLTADGLNVDEVYRNSSMTAADRHYEDLEPVAARCDRAALSRIMQRRLHSLTTCAPSSRYWCAISSLPLLLFSGEAGARSAAALRTLDADSDESSERYARSCLLLFEIRDLTPQQQHVRLVESHLKGINQFFEAVLKPLSSDDVDALVQRYRSATAGEQTALLSLLCLHQGPVSDDAWSWIETFTSEGEAKSSQIAFQLLWHIDARRFGDGLQARGWAWEPNMREPIAHYGSLALISATLSGRYDQLAPRLAPWTLFAAARIRGSVDGETQLAAEWFERVLSTVRGEAPDPGADLSVEVARRDRYPFALSIAVRRNADENDVVAALKSASNVDESLAELRRTADVALGRLEAARNSGASLLLVSVHADDVEPVIEAAPELVSRWLDGMTQASLDFRKRVHLADGFYLALCEALLRRRPHLGAQLWHALKGATLARYIGQGDVEELTHIAFRTPDGPEADELRTSLLELPHCNTDRMLYDVAVAALVNKQSAWLERFIVKDASSTCAWRRRRALILQSFLSPNSISMPEAWPSGPLATDHAELEKRCARRRVVEACASHWWQSFVDADDPETAYASWVLFMSSADNRSTIYPRLVDDGTDLSRRKSAHVTLCSKSLDQRVDRRVDQLSSEFLGRKTSAFVWPWAHRR